jgi:nitroimidazol reductase NimA-like FMN-containing flavoprotein (pyridoxamine 5'-phosphate oxidase superfamily)
MSMDIVRMPHIEKAEYDQILRDEYICRIAFKGETHPYIVPFLYVFDDQFMYFLSTKYGRKVQYFGENPNVAVEVERYSYDLSNFGFVSLFGRLVEVEDPEDKRSVRSKFIDLIKRRGLSLNVLSALGYAPDEPIESILSEGRNSVWKLADVKEIVGLKDLDSQ